MNKLQVMLNGDPVHLYWFSIGRGDDRRSLIVSHPSPLSKQDVRMMLLAAVDRLPETLLPIDPHNSDDLLKRLLPLAGFTDVSADIPTGLWVPYGGGCFHEREWLEKALKHPLRL